MSTVSRAGTKSSEPWRSSMTKASRPITTRPCIDSGLHGPFATAVGMKPSPCLVKKGWFVMARDHDGNGALKSRGRRAPLLLHADVGLAAGA
ncbi:hypothetical protein ABIB82_005092 [Bradyrhizobium sp. i1.8.4]